MESIDAKDNAIAFSRRLGQALQQRGKRRSATGVEREFNLRYRGQPVTVQAVRKWLTGLSLPTQDKLQILARWLDVHEDWLRWGVTEPAPSRQRMANSQEILAASEEASVLQDWKLLESRHRRIVRSVIEVLLRDQMHKDI